MMENQRERYEEIWQDIKTFAEYSSMCDPKFFDRAESAMLLPLCGGGFKTVDEYLETAKEKHENTVYYAGDEQIQAQYISLYRKQGIEVALLDRFVDTQYIQMLENKRSGVKFVRVDADVAGALKTDGENKEASEALVSLFKEASGSDKLKITLESLVDASVPAILNVSEDSRRMDDMMKMYATINGGEERPSFTEETLCLNLANGLAAKLADKSEYDETDRLIARQLYALAALSQRRPDAKALEAFLNDSYEILNKITEK